MKNENRLALRQAPHWWPIAGVLLVACSITPPHILHLPATLSPGWVDGLRGLLAGIGIGLELCFVIRLARFRRGAEKTAIYSRS